MKLLGLALLAGMIWILMNLVILTLLFTTRFCGVIR